jgi:hypothetical protein
VIPVGDDNSDRARRPVVTWAIAGVLGAHIPLFGFVANVPVFVVVGLWFVIGLATILLWSLDRGQPREARP